MTNETTQNGRLIMTVIAIIIGLFMIYQAPFISMKALTPALHRV